MVANPSGWSRSLCWDSRVWNVRGRHRDFILQGMGNHYLYTLKTVEQFLKKLNTEFPSQPAIPLLSVYTQKIKNRDSKLILVYPCSWQQHYS